MMSEKLEKILRYLELGYSVIPLEPCSKKPFSYLAAHGCYSATNNPTLVRIWLEHEPGMNVGVAIPRGVGVLDFDSRREFKTLLRFVDDGTLEAASRSLTPRGVHVWVRLPELPPNTRFIRRYPNRKNPIFELKTHGSYVVEAPSTSGSRDYVWEKPLCSPQGLVELSAKLIDKWGLITCAKPWHKIDPRHAEALINYAIDEVRTSQPGTRHATFLHRAAQLGGTLCGPVREWALKELRQAALQAGLPRPEADAVIRWVLKQEEAAEKGWRGEINAKTR